MTMEKFTELIGKITGYTEWIMLFLVIGGGLVLVFYSKLKPYLSFRHAVNVVAGKYDKEGDAGEVSHFQALAAVVAATVGMGNISGVALAIYNGGPGVVFWMWMTALVGMCIKFYSCGLAILFRTKDEKGNVLGGPMYYMVNGLGKFGKPLAVFFSATCLMGVLPMFTVNQFTQGVIEVVNPDQFLALGEFKWRVVIGVILVVLTSFVIFGGLKKIVKVSSALVPFMVIVYMLAAAVILFTNSGKVLPSFGLIFSEAFNFETAVKGGFWGLVVLGVRRAVFSNESGLGTAPMYHGQSKTNEPVQEGLVAMLGPFIDTIIVCTITALIIIISGAYLEPAGNGILLTLHAFDELLYGLGNELLLVLISVFAISTLFTYSYYGTKALTFLGGAKVGRYYNHVYIASIVLAAVASVELVVGFIDLAFALMSIPNMIAVVWLAPKMNAAIKTYFNTKR